MTGVIRTCHCLIFCQMFIWVNSSPPGYFPEQLQLPQLVPLDTNRNDNFGDHRSYKSAQRSSGSGSVSIGIGAGGRGTEFFDLSYIYDNSTIFLPGQRFNRFHLLMDIASTNRTSSNYEFAYNAFSVCYSEHGGTHIDAPFHYNRYGWKVGEIPLESLVDLPTALIDVEQEVFSLEDPTQFSLESRHLQEHESRFGRIPSGALILVHFGWAKRYWSDVRRYTGFDNSTAGIGGPLFTFSYPTVSANAASWLLRERGIVGLGTDTLSPDVATTNPIVHILLLENQVYLLENVAYLHYMIQRIGEERRSNCDLRSWVLPIKSMGTGGPVRLVSYCKN